MPINRRRFIQTASLVPAAGSLMGFGALQTMPSRPNPVVRVAATPDVVVVGAGVFGTFTALRLLERGLSVILLDAYGPGNSRASSGGETRILRIGHDDRELYARWGIKGREQWRAYEQQWGRQLFLPTGQLEVAPRWTKGMEETKRSYERLHVDFEVLKPDELVKRWPQIHPEGIEIATFEPGAGVLKAREAVMAAAHAFQQKGGTLRITRAQPGSTSGQSMENVLLSSGERLAASHIVFACGPWLGKVLPEVVGTRITTPRREVIFFGTPSGDDRFSSPNMPPVREPPRFFTFPSIEGRGFKISIGGTSQQIDPDTEERFVSTDLAKKAHDLMSFRFPGLKGQPVVETRVCQYENTADTHFLVDRHPELENVWIVGGGSGHGFQHGPILGEYVADRLMGRPTDPELQQVFKLR